MPSVRISNVSILPLGPIDCNLPYQQRLGYSLQASARLDAVEITVDVDLQQNRGMVSKSASVGWNGAVKTQFDQVTFIDEDVDYPHRVGIADVVVETLGK